VAGRNRRSPRLWPFLNLSGDSGNEHVADGLTELLITNLASLPSLRVVSRTSSMHYKNTQMRLNDIARELNVTRVVEGSVLRSAHNLQVIVQVIDPVADTHLFTRTYTRDLTDLLRLQNEIAWTVAGEISTTLEPGDRPRLPLARPLSSDASEAYLRARHFWAQRTPDSMAKAIREYELCIAAAPDFAAAHAGLALCFELQAFYGVVLPAAVADRARELAERAYVLEPTSAEALTSMGALRMIFDLDLAGAKHFYALAVAANPSYDIARLGLGDCFLFRHDFDGALREIHAAVRVSPFDLGLQRNVADFLIFARRFDQAISQLWRTLDIGPHFWPARCLLAEVLALTGDAAGAKQQIERVREDIPVAAVHQPEAFVYAALGETKRASEILMAMEAARTVRYVSPFVLARTYAMLGDADAAFRWIDQGIVERCPANLGLDIQPGFDRLHDDPRFADRLRQLGLSPRG